MRRLLLITTTALVVALAGVAVVFLRERGSAGDATNAGVEATAPAEEQLGTTAPTRAPTAEELAEQAERDEIRALAVVVTERYGSYSTATIAEIPGSLSAFLTGEAIADVQNFVRREQAKYADATDAIGFSTRALSPRITAYTAGRAATVVVTTQREERVARGLPTRTQPVLVLDLVKDGDWKVRSLSWETSP